jgi:hypothetical protein
MAEAYAAFIEKYHQIVDELDRTGRSDPETMLLLGSLVARLVAGTNANNWTQLKQVLNDDTLRELVETLDSNATAFDVEGKTKAAYVARLLGSSLVAGRIDEPRTHQRDLLLSHFIDTAAYTYITSHNAPKG